MAVGMMDNAVWGPIPRYHNLNCFLVPIMALILDNPRKKRTEVMVVRKARGQAY